MTTVTFSMTATTKGNEVVGVTGSTTELGDWDINKSIILAFDTNSAKWKTEVKFKTISTIKYRYFIGVFETQEDSTQKLIKICEWEAGNGATIRTANLAETKVIIDEKFGIINGKNISNQGWLVSQTEVRFNISDQGVEPFITWNDENLNTDVQKLKISFSTDDTSEVKIKLIKPYEYSEFNGDTCVNLAKAEEEVLTFISEVNNLENFSGKFSIFDENTNFLAHANVIGKMLDQSIDYITLSLQNDKEHIVGSLRLEYTVTKPYKNELMTTENTFRNYWKKRPMLDIGHRGSGNSFTAETPSDIYENTILSFKQAGRHGAAMVEFDVQLTKDKVPIVFHDFTICTLVETKTHKQKISMKEVEVQSLTFEELQNYKTRHRHRKISTREPEFDEDSLEADLRPFPTLKEVFNSVPEMVGFDVEIKWPHYFKDKTWYHGVENWADANEFLDLVFDVVFKYAGNRRIVFSCFEANICTMIQRKQNRFPVFYLSQGELDPQPFMELRSRFNSLVVSFAASEQFLGIVMGDTDVYADPKLVSKVEKAGLVFFLYGDSLLKTENREMLEKLGIDAVIYDRIHHERPVGPNIFEIEEAKSVGKNHI